MLKSHFIETWISIDSVCFRHSGSYQDHSSQYVDQYQHSGYNNSMPQQSSGYTNNGYGQSYGNNAAPVSYAPQTDYDHTASSGYQDYK